MTGQARHLPVVGIYGLRLSLFITEGDQLHMPKTGQRMTKKPHQSLVYYEAERACSGNTGVGLVGVQSDGLSSKAYPVHETVEYATFEELAFFRIYGSPATGKELYEFRAMLYAEGLVPAQVYEMIYLLRHAPPILAMRTAISALPAFYMHENDLSAVKQKAVQVVAQLSVIVAAHHAIRQGKQPIQPSPLLSYTANLLFMLHGEAPTEHMAKMIDKAFMHCADHALDKVTSAACIASGGQRDIHAALIVALMEFASLWDEKKFECALAEITLMREPEDIAECTVGLWRQGDSAMGFDHAGAQATVDALQSLFRIPNDLFTPVFFIGHVPGWISEMAKITCST